MTITAAYLARGQKDKQTKNKANANASLGSRLSRVVVISLDAHLLKDPRRQWQLICALVITVYAAIILVRSTTSHLLNKVVADDQQHVSVENKDRLILVSLVQHLLLEV